MYNTTSTYLLTNFTLERVDFSRPNVYYRKKSKLLETKIFDCFITKISQVQHATYKPPGNPPIKICNYTIEPK